MRCDRRRTQGLGRSPRQAARAHLDRPNPVFSRHATSDVGYRGVLAFVGLTPVADDAGRSPAGTTAHIPYVYTSRSHPAVVTITEVVSKATE